MASHVFVDKTDFYSMYIAKEFWFCTLHFSDERVWGMPQKTFLYVSIIFGMTYNESIVVLSKINQTDLKESLSALLKGQTFVLLHYYLLKSQTH